jgi:hypothetical protein
VDFIVVGVLGVDGVAVDVVQDVVGGEEVICTAAKCSPINVEVDHLVFAHGLGLEMNPEGVAVVVSKMVAKTLCKLFPRGPHELLLGHPSERADTKLILFKHHDGIELAYDFLVVLVAEGHQRNDPKFFTNGLCFAKILGL